MTVALKLLNQLRKKLTKAEQTVIELREMIDQLERQ